MKKKLVNFYLHPDTIAALKRVASEKHLSQAAIVQMALNAYLAEHDQPDRTTDEKAEYKPGK